MMQTPQSHPAVTPASAARAERSRDEGTSTRAASAERAVPEVARELMYAANRYSDLQIDARDVASGSKLGAALLQILGKPALTELDVRSSLRVYAGPDGRLDASEFGRLQDDVQAITDHIPTRHSSSWPADVPADVSARWLMARGDVNVDGVVDAQDVGAGSEYASVMMNQAGEHSFDVEGVQAATLRMYPHLEPNEGVRRFMGDVNADVAFWIGARGGRLGDLARADVRVFDTNQDLRLTAEDGRSARITLKLVGQPRSTNVEDVLASYRTFDTKGYHGASPDGRLDREEYTAYGAARRKVADTVPPDPTGH